MYEILIRFVLKIPLTLFKIAMVCIETSHFNKKEHTCLLNCLVCEICCMFTSAAICWLHWYCH